MRQIFFAAALSLCIVATPAIAQGVPVAVYDCYGPGMAEGGTVNNTAGQLSVSGAKFSVIGPGLYMSRGGKAGHFAFDGFTLAMIDGPYAGLRYHKATPRWTFRMLRANGVEGPFMCPMNSGKNPRQPNGW